MQRSRSSEGGPERYILALALLLPLVVVGLAVAQLPTIDMRVPSTLVYADAAEPLRPRHPAASAAEAPPTLAVPTATPRPTATPVPAAPTVAPTLVPSPTAAGARTYTVQRGDELRHIAAQYGVSIWKIIDNNDIPNPDSLRVGQVLRIPDS